MAETKGFFTRDFGSTVIYPTRLGDSIQLKGLTSGSVNIIVPSVVGGDYTLTLPSITGTIALVGHTQTISTISDATTVGQNLVKLTNPSTITFIRINADNTISALSDSAFRTAIGAGSSTFDGTWGSLSGKPANVVSIGSLANATGWLHNDGAGVFAYSTPTAANVGAEASGAVATHAALTTGVHGLAITVGQTLTVTTGGTLGTAAYTASSAYAAVAQTMYIGTTAVTINQASGTLNLAGIGTLNVGAITSTATALKLGTQTKNILTAGLLLGSDASVIEFSGSSTANGSGIRMYASYESMPNDCIFYIDGRVNSGSWSNIVQCLIQSSVVWTFQGNLYSTGRVIASMSLEATTYVKSGAPAGGTSGNWKFGIRVAATTIHDVTQYIQLDIGGTLYKLALAV